MDKDNVSLKELRKELENADPHKLYKMAFVFKALEEGWTIKKGKGGSDHYICKKNHDRKKYFFSKNYSEKFIKENSTIQHLLKKIYN
tara:strand:- start:56 stop:316 length:261 start_codon:yes stop_codon:yes gene_type:complete